MLESIEGHFKISFANVLAKTYGANAHLLNSIYRNKHYFDNFLMLYEREKYKQSKVKFIQHNINKYGELPIWVAIEILSFGPISKLYKNLNLNDDKKDISEEFLSQKKASVTPYYLQNWLEVAGTLRNRCAHHSRVYNRTIPVTVNLHKTYINNGKRLSTSDIDRNSVFAVFLVIKRMVCKESQWSEIMLRLEELFTKYEHTIESQKMGFPENWRDYLFTELQAI